MNFKTILASLLFFVAFTLSAQSPADTVKVYPKTPLYFTNASAVDAKILPANIYCTSVGHYGKNVQKFRITGFNEKMDVTFQLEIPMSEIKSLDLSGHLLTVESTKGSILYFWGTPEQDKE